MLRSDYARHTLLLGGLAFIHACLFSFVRKRETACDVLRFYSAVGRDRLSAFSRRCAVIGLCLVHFGMARFFAAIPTEDEETRRTESAARRGYVFAQTH